MGNYEKKKKTGLRDEWVKNTDPMSSDSPLTPLRGLPYRVPLRNTLNIRLKTNQVHFLRGEREYIKPLTCVPTR